MQLDKEQIALLVKEYEGIDLGGFLNEIKEWYEEPGSNSIVRNVLENVLDILYIYLERD